MTATLHAVAANAQHVCELLGELRAEQLSLYGHAEPAHADPADFAAPRGLFLLAFAQQRPIGCGGVRTYEPGVAEVRKMFVRPGYRGRGIGRRLLNELEASARAGGALEVRLETGTRNVEALQLYRTAGYRSIPSYVPGRGEVNVAFAKALH
ncbi:GNAT family N-acetyltransferase [Saccharopolyspora erythraea]|uniref:GNAT family N-acetyltransferase n=1 Tax=Saccharopolyspora erythraea TaxID=1836 RepID=UPI0012FBD712|nr:GNAT family N-acetyltransferase [Saccharopolyspora erythraea]QRK87052.1 GNAT family N-acetyltransferase [Saccharopolyspora erythraea]